MPMISFNNICKIYSRNKVFYNADLSIEKGDFVFLTGESGSGKTTFMRLISGLEKPDRGKILVNNSDITKLSQNGLSDYRRKIGLIMQDNIKSIIKCFFHNFCPHVKRYYKKNEYIGIYDKKFF